MLKDLENVLNTLNTKEYEAIITVLSIFLKVCRESKKSLQTAENDEKQRNAITIRQNKAIANAVVLIGGGVSFETVIPLMQKKYGLPIINRLEKMAYGGWNCHLANAVEKELNTNYHTKLKPHQKSIIKKWYASGVSLRKIGNMYGVSKDTVRRICNDNKK